MRIGHSTELEYSKITCFNASREILTRFIAHRSFNPMSSCSRPVDFFALLASMTLLLAHLDTHHHREATNFLAHQRLSDRAMLHQALERMDLISNFSKDIVTAKSASLIRRLFDIEADAAEGSNYTLRIVKEDDEEGQKEGEDLHLQIPYIGVIKIARQGHVPQEPWLRNATSPPHPASQVALSQTQTAGASDVAFATSNRATPADGQPLIQQHGIAHGFTCPGPLPASELPSAQWQVPAHQQTTLQDCNSRYDNHAPQPSVGLPPIAAGVEDWAFQGVDMAFFDSLMRGTSAVDPTGLEQQWIGGLNGNAQ